VNAKFQRLRNIPQINETYHQRFEIAETPRRACEPARAISDDCYTVGHPLQTRDLWTRVVRHPVTFRTDERRPITGAEARIFTRAIPPLLARHGLQVRPRLFPPHGRGFFCPEMQSQMRDTAQSGGASALSPVGLEPMTGRNHDNLPNPTTSAANPYEFRARAQHGSPESLRPAPWL
jgi:hypothetical protein